MTGRRTARATAAVLSLLVAMGTTACSKSHDAAHETAHATADSTHGAAPHWDYGAEHGPAHWAEMSPEYIACAEGVRQSPIDLSSTASPAARNEAAVALHVDQAEHATTAIDNGHTIQVDCEGEDALRFGEESFRLAQYHFHAPGEHTVDGRSFPMELHMVHRSESGRLAVLGLLIREGAANPAFEAVWSRLPEHAGEKVALQDVPLDVERLVPKNHVAWSYEGSLTTPPCSEGVRWLVLVEPITLSAEQIARFRGIISANNRPTQSLHDRAVRTTMVVPETER